MSIIGSLHGFVLARRTLKPMTQVIVFDERESRDRAAVRVAKSDI